MKHKIWYDEKEGILHIKYVGEMSVEDFRAMNRKLNAMPPEYRLRSLVNLSQLATPIWDKKPRQILAPK